MSDHCSVEGQIRKVLRFVFVEVDHHTELTTTEGGEPAARLVAITPAGNKRIGSFAGQLSVPVDFDETPSELTEYFT
jgi:antitoxin (DNA-binding transcriptional repressor) of toxin-antitoxin stability system